MCILKKYHLFTVYLYLYLYLHLYLYLYLYLYIYYLARNIESDRQQNKSHVSPNEPRTSYTDSIATNPALRVCPTKAIEWHQHLPANHGLATCPGSSNPAGNGAFGLGRGWPPFLRDSWTWQDVKACWRWSHGFKMLRIWALQATLISTITLPNPSTDSLGVQRVIALWEWPKTIAWCQDGVGAAGHLPPHCHPKFPGTWASIWCQRIWRYEAPERGRAGIAFSEDSNI